MNRRTFLGGVSLGGLSWMTALGDLLAREGEHNPSQQPARSLILLWLAGGPSQLETFDPKPGTAMAGGTLAVETSVKSVQLAEGLPRTAGEMSSLTIIRSMVGKEGDHERGSYLMKTGFRPDPTIVHPAIGAVCCHELPAGGTEIPRHISILPGPWPARGGYLGDEYDAFKTWDPEHKVPDVISRTPRERDDRRLRSLDVVERAFSVGRRERIEATLHRETVKNARRMMSSEQLKAFEVGEEPRAVREAYGITPFGRGCLAARRLIEVGARCVEVTLHGWDSHANNHAVHRDLLAVLDPALSGLLRDLCERKLLDKTVVLCGGEFGRTPRINAAGGRDHWPTGFSVVLAGGCLLGSHVHGQTDPQGGAKPVDPVSVADLHATLLAALGIDHQKLFTSPIGRTVRLSEGRPVRSLLRS